MTSTDARTRCEYAGAMTAPEPIVGRIEVVLSDAQLLELLRQADADTTTDDHEEAE